MNDEFKIFVDRIRNGNEEVLKEELSSGFLGNEKEILFSEKVNIEGRTYVVDEELILQLLVETDVTQSCLICNERVKSSIKSNFCHTEPLSEVKGMVFDFREVLRENLLLEISSFVECNNGKCSKRQDLSKYLVTKGKKSDSKEKLHQPFKNLL
jgi:hypothetical protein